MVKMRWMAVSAAVLLLLASGSALATIRPDTVTFSPLVGKYLFEGNEGLKNRGVYGLGVGYNFDENWAGEAVFRYVDTQDTAGNEKSVDVMSGEADLLYHFLPDQLFVPYLAGGVGAIRINPGSDAEEDLLVNYGAGFKYFFTDNMALRGDARHILDIASGSQPRSLPQPVAGRRALHAIRWGPADAPGDEHPLRACLARRRSRTGACCSR